MKIFNPYLNSFWFGYIDNVKVIHKDVKYRNYSVFLLKGKYPRFIKVYVLKYLYQSDNGFLLLLVLHF